MHKWETIQEDSEEKVERMQVPGGYIYRSTMWDFDENNRYILGTTTQSMAYVED